MKKFRRVIALLITMVMLLQPAAFALSVTDFIDFPNDWSTEAMTAAVDNKLLHGNGNKMIEPSRPITRAEFAALVVRAFGATIEADISALTDVTEDDWFYSEVAKAYQMGALNGRSETIFDPNANITREEAFTVMARILCIVDGKESNLNFEDSKSISDYAKVPVAGLVQNGYINGYPDGTIRPQDDITRAESAQMFHNLFKTYISVAGFHSVVNPVGSVVVRAPGVKLENVIINGDLIIADGVGAGNFDLTSVTVNGRILARGGEGKVTFKSVSVENGVIIYDNNGTVNFNNYRDEAPFKELTEYTPATFLKREATGGGISGSTPSGNKNVKVTVKFVADGVVLNPDSDYGIVFSTKTGLTKDDFIAQMVLPEGYNYVEGTSRIGRDVNFATVAGFPLSNATTLYVQVFANVYEVTFEGYPTYTDTITHGDKVTNVPTVDDTTTHYFDGWYVYDEDGNLITTLNLTDNKIEDYAITQKVTFKPVMTEKGKVTVTFYNEDGSATVGAAQTIYEGGKVDVTALPTAPVVEGKTFSHWSDTKGGAQFNFNDEINASTALYAVYTTNEYTVTFKNADGTADIDTATIAHGNGITATDLPAETDIPEITGKHFVYWSTAVDGAEYVLTTPVTGEITLYAVYATNEYTVTFKNADGTADIDTATIAHGNGITATDLPAEADIPEITGKHFVYWSTAVDGAEYVLTTPVTGEITLYAVYEANEYEVTFEGYPTYTHTITHGDKVTNVPTVDDTTTHYFDGWHVYDENGNLITTLNLTDNKIEDYAITQKVTFKPVMTEKGKVTVTFYNEDGSATVGTAQTFHIGGKIDVTALPAAPVVEGKTFSHWSDTKDGAQFNFNDEINASTALYAVYTTNEYTVTFKNADGTADIDTATIAHGNGITATDLPAETDIPEITGKHFVYWSTAVDGAEYVLTTPVTGEITLYAVYEANEYEVTFEGYPTYTDTITHGDKVTNVPTVDDTTTHYFDGWYVYDENGNLITTLNLTDNKIEDYAITQKVTFKPVMTEKGKVTVTFYNEDGSLAVGTAQTFHIGGKIDVTALPAAPVVEGKTFSHWSDTKGGAQFNFNDEINASTALYAVYEANEYEVTFEGYPAYTDTIAHGEFVTNIPVVDDTQEQYFDGWEVYDENGNLITTLNLTDNKIEDYAITQSVKFVPVMEDKLVVIFMNIDGSVEVDTVYVKPGEAITTAPTAPSVENKTFKWWSLAVDGAEYDLATALTEDITLYAVYDNLYTVRFWDLLISGDEFEDYRVTDLEYEAQVSEDKIPVLGVDADFVDYTELGFMRAAGYADAYASMDGVTTVEGKAVQHIVYYTWWYNTAEEGEEPAWEVFNSDVKVTKDIDVYPALKKFTVGITVPKVEIPGTLLAYYNEDTRAIDTLKDALVSGEGVIGLADKQGSFDFIFEKMAEKNVIKVDGDDKIILNQHKFIKLVDVLGEARIKSMIMEVVGDSSESGDAKEFVEKYIQDITNITDETQKQAVAEKLSLMFEEVLKEENLTPEFESAITEILVTLFSSHEENLQLMIYDYIEGLIAAGKTDKVNTLICDILKEYKALSGGANLKTIITEFIIEEAENEYIEKAITDFILAEIKKPANKEIYRGEFVDYLNGLSDDELIELVKVAIGNDITTFEDEIVDMLKTDRSFAVSMFTYAYDNSAAVRAEVKALVNDEVRETILADAEIREEAVAAVKTAIKDEIIAGLGGITPPNINDLVEQAYIDNNGEAKVTEEINKAVTEELGKLTDNDYKTEITKYLNNTANDIGTLVSDVVAIIEADTNGLADTFVDEYVTEAVTEDKLGFINDIIDAVYKKPALFENENIKNAMNGQVAEVLTDVKNGDLSDVDAYIDNLIATDSYSLFVTAFINSAPAMRKTLIYKLVDDVFNSDAFDTILAHLITSILHEEHLDHTMVIHLVEYLMTDADTLRDLTDAILHNITPEMLIAIAAALGQGDAMSSLEKVNQLIDELCHKDYVTISEDRLFMFEPIVEWLETYNLDYVKSKIPPQAEPFITETAWDKVKKLFERFVDDGTTDVNSTAYVSKLKGYMELAKADPDVEYTFEQGTGVTVMINPVYDLIVPVLAYYDEMMPILKNKLGTKFDTYYGYYENNPYVSAIEAFVDVNKWFDIDDASLTTGFAEGSSGYKLKKITDSGIDSYYDNITGLTLLLDDAMSWYFEEVPDDKIDDILTVVTDKAFAVTNLILPLIEDYALNGVPGTADELMEDAEQLLLNAESDPELKDYLKKFGAGAYLDRIAGNPTFEGAADTGLGKLGTRAGAFIGKIAESALNRTYDDGEREKIFEFLIGLFTDVKEDQFNMDEIFDKYLNGITSKTVSASGKGLEASVTVERSLVIELD